MHGYTLFPAFWEQVNSVRLSQNYQLRYSTDLALLFSSCPLCSRELQRSPLFVYLPTHWNFCKTPKSLLAVLLGSFVDMWRTVKTLIGLCTCSQPREQGDTLLLGFSSCAESKCSVNGLPTTTCFEFLCFEFCWWFDPVSTALRCCLLF